MLDHHVIGHDFYLNPQRIFLLLLCLWRALSHKLLHVKFHTCSFLCLAAGAEKMTCPNVLNYQTKKLLSVEWYTAHIDQVFQCSITLILSK